MTTSTESSTHRVEAAPEPRACDVALSRAFAFLGKRGTAYSWAP